MLGQSVGCESQEPGAGNAGVLFLLHVGVHIFHGSFCRFLADHCLSNAPLSTEVDEDARVRYVGGRIHVIDVTGVGALLAATYEGGVPVLRRANEVMIVRAVQHGLPAHVTHVPLSLLTFRGLLCNSLLHFLFL